LRLVVHGEFVVKLADPVRGSTVGLKHQEHLAQSHCCQCTGRVDTIGGGNHSPGRCLPLNLS
jgi:hypothetical protein